MSQMQILDILEKTNKWMDVNEIFKITGYTKSTITTALVVLRKWNFVEWRHKPGVHVNVRHNEFRVARNTQSK